MPIAGASQIQQLTSFLALLHLDPTGPIIVSHQGVPFRNIRRSSITAKRATHTMCTKVVHTYPCGHQLIQTAPCADKGVGSCKGVKEKIVPHTEKCDRICGG